MPGLDRRGPMGSGPMTGGRRGLCANTVSPYDMPVSGGLGYGRGLGLQRGFRNGLGQGRGRGRGFGWRFTESPGASGYEYAAGQVNEMEMLKAEANAMQESLTAIQKRITELETYHQESK